MRLLPVALLVLALAAPVVAEGEDTALHLYSNPPGALVALDHRVLGYTPILLSPILPGRHELRLSAGADYRPYLVLVDVQPGLEQRLDVELEPAPPLLIRQALEAQQAGRDDEALALLQRATPAPDAWWYLGELHLARGRDAEALQAFRKYAGFHPEQPRVYEKLGALHERGGRTAEAVTAYKLALLHREGWSDALQGLPQHPTWGSIAAAGHPTEARAQLRLAHLYELKGRMDEALRWLRSALAGKD